MFVASKLGGRLGNQLYQHAAGIALALKNNVEYFVFPKKESPAEPDYLKGLFPVLPSTREIQHMHLESDARYKEIPFRPNMCLEGYWQSHKYFEGLEDKIFPMFNITPVVKLDTIGVHVRQGDFLTITGKHIIMSDEYKRKAIRYYNVMEFKKFMVFSDDIERCKPFFLSDEFKDLEFIFSEGRTPIEDMAELSGCAHQICSASTYSYWGYYLNPNKDKTCILPDKLWGETHANTPTDDTYPPNCIKIPN